MNSKPVIPQKRLNSTVHNPGKICEKKTMKQCLILGLGGKPLDEHTTE